MNFGHLSFEPNNYSRGPEISRDVLIVGGGVAGLAAACSLKEGDFLVCELSGRLGGTSTAFNINGQLFAQGAHYDLAYPDNYGEEAINSLKNLNIIQYNTFRRMWEFVDKQYIIPPATESRCYAHGSYREDVLPAGPLKNNFIQLISEFQDDMIMPTRLIKKKYHYLNNITFSEYLNKNLDIPTQFKNGLDYNLRDDYGGGSDKVSALAGIHYYQCRPYYTKPVELFSPPQGNYYFIDKMAASLPKERIMTNQLVYRIEKSAEGFNVGILDRNTHEVVTARVMKIIYAGNKHVLKYSFPEDYSLFKDNVVAPWAVMNIVLNKELPGDTYWQNEILSDHPSMIGYVNSKAQYLPAGSPSVITAYFCLDPANRNQLVNLEDNKYHFTGQVIELIGNTLDTNLKKLVSEVIIRVFGHAMPVPVPGYLFKDKNQRRSQENLVYAGVDNHRLPLFFEAFDSGIFAAGLL